jgi:hypothetical protein
MWLVAGFILGIGFLFLVFWLRDRGLILAWYEWLSGILGFLLLLFTIQNFTASRAELEPVAPFRYLIIFGLPSIVLLTLAFLLPWRRYHPTGPSTAK